MSVCVSVCLCVCVCVCNLYSPNGWADFYETFYKWSGRYLPVTFFTDFENSKLLTSWRPFCMFFNAALSRSQFCSDFLQNWVQGTKLSSGVCYWKSAKSVGNFRQYGNLRFRKKKQNINENDHQIFFLIWASNMSISTNSDLLITNLIFLRFDE